MTDDGERFVLNPTVAQMEFSDLDLVLSGHSDGVNMIEVGAAEVPDDVVLDAITFGYEEGIKPILEMQLELVEKAGATQGDAASRPCRPRRVIERRQGLIDGRLTEARKIAGKADRTRPSASFATKLLEEHFPVPEDVPYARAQAPRTAPAAGEGGVPHASRRRSRTCSSPSTASGPTAEVSRRSDRSRWKPGIFSRTHGSAFFQRGETQSLVTCALGTDKAEQIVDGLLPEYAKKFYLHYNFPPFCVGEAGRIMGPGRRESRPRRAGGAIASRDHARAPRTSPTPSDWSATSPSPTARRAWPRCAAAAWR